MVLTVPLVPEEARGLALQNDGEGKRRNVDGVEDVGPIDETVGRVVRGGREDAQIEENYGGADKPSRHRVQAHIDPENEQKPRDMVIRHIPHVGAHPEGCGADVCCGKGGAARLFWGESACFAVIIFLRLVCLS